MLVQINSPEDGQEIWKFRREFVHKISHSAAVVQQLSIQYAKINTNCHVIIL
jgi:hypothetical protein